MAVMLTRASMPVLTLGKRYRAPIPAGRCRRSLSHCGIRTSIAHSRDRWRRHGEGRRRMAVLRAAGAHELSCRRVRRGDVQHRPAGPDLAGSRLAISPPLSTDELARITAGIRRGGGGEALSYLPPRRPPRSASSSRLAPDAHRAFAKDLDEIIVTSSKAGDQPLRRALTLEPGDVAVIGVCHLRRHTGTRLRQTGARG